LEVDKEVGKPSDDEQSGMLENMRMKFVNVYKLCNYVEFYFSVQVALL
jgi:hypothetical protein